MIAKRRKVKNTTRFSKVSHGGGPAIFWGCAKCHRPGDLVSITGSMDQSQYLTTLSDNDYLSGDGFVGESLILLQDNALCHKGRMITNFLGNVEVTTFDWLPQNPDLYII